MDDTTRRNLIVDTLTKAILQCMTASYLHPIEKFHLSYQSIDNTLSALLQSRRILVTDHGAKLQQFGKEFVVTRQYPSSEAKKIKRYLERWQTSRFGQREGPPVSFEDANEVHMSARLLLDFAVSHISLELQIPVTKLMNDVNSHSRKRYSRELTGLKPEITPGYSSFDALGYVQEIREECAKLNRIESYDIGGISGLVNAQVFGLMESNKLTQLETEMLSDSLSRLREAFNDLIDLVDHSNARMRSGGHFDYYSLKWNMAFNHLVRSLWYAIEDDVGLEGLHRLFSNWDAVIDLVHDVSIGKKRPAGLIATLLPWIRKQPSEKKHIFDRFYGAKELVKEWSLEHPGFFQQMHIDSSVVEENEPTLEDLERELMRTAVVLTTSPMAMDRYGGRLENMIEELWKYPGGEFLPEEISKIIALEESGVDVVQSQLSQGIPITRVCFGLRELAYRLRRRGITDEEDARLRSWDWFRKRFGDKGLEKLKQYVAEERGRDWIARQ